MDIDRFLDIERRTGVKNEDIDDFLSKASAVEAAIKGLKDGSIDPNKMPKIAGIETDEEKAEKERLRLERLKILQEKESALQIKRKAEEKERWWLGAEFYRSNVNDDDDEMDENNSSNTSDNNNRTLLERYNLNYSRWDSWVPSDPISLAEKEEQEKLEEKLRNDEFEKANPEFCSQHLEDMKERNKTNQKKQESSDIARLKANRFFKQKDYDTALRLYVDALKTSPYDVRTLINMAQVYIKKLDHEEALEYISRVLYLDAKHVKALSRKAYILYEGKKYEEALEAATKAFKIEPTNKDIAVQVEDIKAILKSAEESNKVQQLNQLIETLGRSDLNSTTASDDVMRASKYSLLKNLIKRLSDGKIKLEAKETLDLQLPSSSEVNIFDAICELISDDDDSKILARSMDAISICSAFIHRIFDNFKNNPDAIFLAPSVKLLSLLSADDVLSKQILLEKDTLHLIKSHLVSPECCSPSSLSSTNDDDDNDGVIIKKLQFISSSVYLLHQASSDSKVRKALKTYEDEFVKYLEVLFNHIFQASHNISNRTVLFEMLYCYKEMALFLKSILASKESTLLTQNVGSIIPNLGLVLYRTCNEFKEKLSKNKTNYKNDFSLLYSTVSGLLEVLGSFSLLETFKNSFSIELSMIYSIPNRKVKYCTAEVILNVSEMQEFSDLKSLSYGVLMNICHNSTETLKLQLIESGALNIIHKQINIFSELTKEDRKLLEQGEEVKNLTGLEISRVFGLLSRLSTLSVVIEKIYSPSLFKLLCRSLSISVGVSTALEINQINALQKSTSQTKPKSEDKTEKNRDYSSLNLQGFTKSYKEDSWVADEKSYLVRILSSSTAALSKECKTIAYDEYLVLVLLLLFPEPKSELGEITPTSVVQTPKDISPPLLLGNAARCLLCFADDPDYADLLYCKNNFHGIERLICTMATCSDIRVRKNIAIILAKGCKFPGTKERLVYFRGMEMIIELQNKF